MKSHQSNDLEVLADFLEKEIFQGSVFDPKYLIVPSSFLKHWLFERWTQKNRYVVAIKSLSIQEALSTFLKKNKDQELCFPSTIELELFIREEIIVSCRSNNPLFSPLKKYLMEDTEEKIAFLSAKLAELFSFYGQYGAEFIVSSNASKNWQEMIYRQIFSKKKLHTPIQELNREIFNMDPCQIHLFCFSYLPPAYFDFFYRLSSKVDVSTYVLSPCEKYWDDLSTNFEERKIRKQYKDVDWLDDFFQTNPILANFGVIGKQYQKIMNQYDLILSDQYVEKKENSLLAHVQNDLLHLQKTEKRTCTSIEMQSVLGTKFDEVQKLQKNLALYFSQGYQPKDIFVLAEDINEYLLFIHTIFADQPLDYKISDISLMHQSFLARGVLHILSLSYEKWTLQDLYQLFENPLLQRKFGFSQEDADLLHKSLTLSKLKFGYDEEHMFSLVGKKIKEHTWIDVFQRLILSFAVRIDEDEEFIYPYPTEEMEISNADIFNIWIGLIESLWSDAKTFQSQSLKGWGAILEKIIDTYFSWGTDDFVEQSSIEVIQNLIRKFKQIPYEADVSVDQIHLILQKELQKKKASYQMHLMDVLHFASLNTGNIKPAKIIYILGMNQDALDKESSLNLLKDTKQFYPTNQSKKKYLLLEHLILAGEKIVFSYPTKAHNTSQELTPSLVLQELRSYMGDFFENSDQEEIFSHFPKAFTMLSYPSTSVEKEIPTVISISSLKHLANNPFDFYLKQKWNINFEIKDANDFSLSSLEKYQMVSSSLEKEFSKVVTLFDQKALLPQGVFKQIAKQEMDISVSSYTSFVENETVYQFQFQKDCKEPFFCENTYVFPAVELSFGEKTCYLVGKLFHVMKKGMVVLKEDNLKEWVRSYPSYLMYLKAIQNLDLFEPNLLFLKSKKIKSLSIQDLDHLLKEYVRYYFVASHVPSPFMSFAVSSLLKQDFSKFEKGYHQAFRDQKNWLINRMDLSNLDEIFATWSLYIQEVFQPLL